MQSLIDTEFLNKIPLLILHNTHTVDLEKINYYCIRLVVKAGSSEAKAAHTKAEYRPG